MIEPHEYEANFPAYMENPELRLINIFAYIYARDLGQMVDCCLKTDGLGFEIFNVSNDDHSVKETSEELRAKFYAGVPIAEDHGSQETFYSNSKTKRLPGFQPAHSWRNYLST